eukprot:TRINITY_DN10000_c0_g1_i2.p1 TRINITY_DN10000_c0_g1~~TRINITY_DN10000_c0_g1_i2.p1  ORF type:complete len:283 (+),score=107.71 TRINITY_DN10000_c0_g1_i2:124-972(+)
MIWLGGSDTWKICAATAAAVPLWLLCYWLLLLVHSSLFEGRVPPSELRVRSQRWLNIIHAVVATTLGVLGFARMLSLRSVVLQQTLEQNTIMLGEDLNDDFVIEGILCLTTGYFFADMLCSRYALGHVPRLELFHHTLSAVQFIFQMLTHWGLFVPLLLQTNEMSTPPLHLAWLCEHSSHLKGTVWHNLALLSFFVLFVVGRILMAPALLIVVSYQTWKYSPFTCVPQWQQVESFVMMGGYCAVQFIFFRDIVAFIGRLRSGEKKNSSSNNVDAKRKKAKSS